MFVRPDNWNELSWQQKRALRLESWINPKNVNWESREAEANYKARATRMAKAATMEIPDRVPCAVPAGWFPAYSAGLPLKEAMYDTEKMKWAWLKFLDEYDSDTYDGPLYFQAKISDLLDSRTQKWPGHGLPDDAHSYQYVEGEYMKADEYDLFMKDPLDFQLRKLLPREMGVFELFAEQPSFSSYQGLPQRLMMLCQDERFIKLANAIYQASKVMPEYGKASEELNRRAMEKGFPFFRGGMAVAPFDVFADSLRGTHGIVRDMFRQPDKIHEGMEYVLPRLVEGGIRMADMTDCPVVQMPLHKGDDTFMSNKQFETFYWPTFKRMLLGLIDEGCLPFPVAEGAYNNRLEYISDMPKSGVVWMFDQTNMANAKKTVGRVSCIVGNIPVSVAYTGTPQDMKNVVRKLIETCAPGGGYIVSGGATFDKAKPENIRAMMDAVKEYGKY